MDNRKPLGRKSYGSIPHLPGSRLGPGDHTCHAGQARIATEKARDNRDFIVVQEKLDGSNVGIARIGNEIYPLTRAGYVANTSPYEQHHLFYDWTLQNKKLWLYFLEDGERLCGEWMAQAHGTIYEDLWVPFYAFDIMREDKRITWLEFDQRIKGEEDIYSVPLICAGPPISIEMAMSGLGPHGRLNALDGPEGAVWRVERDGKVDFLVKYVRPDKVDGKYLPEVSGQPPVWNWLPEEAQP